MTADPAAEYLPPCRKGFRCCDSDRPQGTDGQHTPICPMSPQGNRERLDRIDAMTPREMRAALEYLSGWTPTGTGWALREIARIRAGAVATLAPEHMPEGAL